MKKKLSFEQAIQKQVGALGKEIRQKKGSLNKMLKKEKTLEQKIHSLLQQMVQAGNRELARAKKTKAKTQKTLQTKLNDLKKQHQEYVKRTHLIGKMRLRQTGLQKKIEKLKQFIVKHREKPKPLPKQKKAVVKAIKHIKKVLHKAHKHAAKKITKLISETKQVLSETSEEIGEPTVSPAVEEPPAEMVHEEEPETETEPLPPLEEESHEEWKPEPVEETKPSMEESAAEGMPFEGEAEFKTFEMENISFEYPNWPESTEKTPEALFSVEQNGLRFELFRLEASPSMDLHENVQEFLNKRKDISDISQESINHYMFVTYTQDDNSKHYALFAQSGSSLYKIEANGKSERLDEESGLIVKVFKSFTIQE